MGVEIRAVIQYECVHVNTCTEPRMPTYAVNLGQLVLKADKPITPEERTAAIEYVKQLLAGLKVGADGLRSMELR